MLQIAFKPDIITLIPEACLWAVTTFLTTNSNTDTERSMKVTDPHMEWNRKQDKKKTPCCPLKINSTTCGNHCARWCVRDARPIKERSRWPGGWSLVHLADKRGTSRAPGVCKAPAGPFADPFADGQAATGGRSAKRKWYSVWQNSDGGTGWDKDRYQSDVKSQPHSAWHYVVRPI